MQVTEISFPSYKVLVNEPESNSGSKDTISSTSSFDDSAILEKLELNNHLLSSMIFLIGIVAGLLCMFIFWSRFRKY